MSSTAPEIYLKRVYDPAEPGDGFRVLADRVWPRGIKKTVLQHDCWPREICPPAAVRKAWHHGEIDYQTFQKRFIGALADSDSACETLNALLRHDVVTLLTAAKNPQKGHLAVLRNVLMQMAKGEKVTPASSVCYLDLDTD